MIPVRNDLPRPGREILVLRHHRLRKGGHEEFYRISRDRYWPYFERLGARVVGQWKVCMPASSESDEVYRLVRYASFEHWEATRADHAARQIAGDGPAYESARQALAERARLETGSKGAYFLQAGPSPDGPIFMPALLERYEAGDSSACAAAGPGERAVRLDIARPGDEIVELRYRRIRKGAFDAFAAIVRAAIWPWQLKLGARPLGEWLVIHPGAPDMTQESSEYDEVIALTRYASAEHHAAMDAERALELGGNGPDWQAWSSAQPTLAGMTISTRIEMMQGHLRHGPPIYLPALSERYRRRL